MAPKAKKGDRKGKTGGGAEEEQQEERLQAVVLADSFESRFNPFALERPRCLLPLANAPLIQYTLEFLASNGVQDVWVYCGAHTEAVEEYLAKSKYHRPPASPFASLTVIRGGEARSVGDAMRDLDKRRELEGDFLVVHADLVSNLPLHAALAAHKRRRELDKNAIMTMVLREDGPGGAGARRRGSGREPVFVVDPSKDRCLHYEEMSGAARGRGERVVGIDPDLLSDHAELDILTGVTDTGIDILTPDALALWTDNFDFETPRQGFLFQVLKDYELNGKTVHTYVAGPEQGYARRVRDLGCYDQVSRDVVARLAHPMVPDANFERGQTYRVGKGNRYMEEGVILARGCEVGRGTVVGHRTSIGDGSVVRGCVIGRRCMIGRDVRLEGVFVWDDAVVGDGTVARGAVVANEAHVGRKCVLEPGALVSFGVRIADGVTVGGSSRVTTKRRDSIYPEPVTGDADPKVVGQGGDGFEFVDSEEEDEAAGGAGMNGLVYDLSHLSLSSESISTLNSSSGFDDDIDDGDGEPTTPRTDRSSFASNVSDDDDDDNSATGRSHRAASDFHHDAAASLLDSLQKGDEQSNMQLELTALRMTANASEHQVRRAVVAAFMKRIAQLVDGGAAPRAAVHGTLARYGGLIGRTMFDRGGAGPDKPDQVDFLLLVQADLARRGRGDEVLLWCCYELYNDLDVLEQEGLEQWWLDERGKGEGEMARVRGRMGEFMERLMEEEEEESSDGDEEDGDDDDDDDD